MAFYERGWQGINIEPNPKLHQQLHDHRPRETNLCVALGEREDGITMSVFGKRCLSAFDALVNHIKLILENVTAEECANYFIAHGQVKA